LRTNLIIHHGIADILHQAVKLIHILGAVEKPRDPASLFQWGEVSNDVIKFATK
jgi:hypothetical protein